LNKVIEYLINLIYPYDKCPICEEYTDGLCLSCRKKLRFLSREEKMKSEKGASLLEYNDEGKALMMAFKKRGSFYAGNEIVQLLLSNDRELIHEFDVIAFAPSSRKSISHLGFDHGEYLAKRVGKATGIPVYAFFKPSSKEQKKLDKESRKDNAENIALTKVIPENLKGKKALIIDDVFTTGSTVEKCVSLLKDSGLQAYYLTFFKLM
jgi:competence protein ComFC